MLRCPRCNSKHYGSCCSDGTYYWSCYNCGYSFRSHEKMKYKCSLISQEDLNIDFMYAEIKRLNPENFEELIK